MKRETAFIIALLSTILSLGTVSAGIGIGTFTEIRYDNSSLWLWQGNKFEYSALRLGDNIISSSSLDIEYNGEMYHGGLGSGTIEEKNICVKYLDLFTCLTSQKNVYFSSDFIVIGETTGKEMKGVIRGKLEDLKFNRTYGAYQIYDCKGDCNAELDYVFEKDYEPRISALESWKTTITDTLTQIWSAITGQTTRIETLENSTGSSSGGGGGGGNDSSSAYFKYLSYSDKKNMVCGYGKEIHSYNITDIGVNCVIKYPLQNKYNSTSRTYYKVEVPSCSCRETK